MGTLTRLSIKIDGAETDFKGFIAEDDQIYIDSDLLESLTSYKVVLEENSINIITKNITVVLDKGHGGTDPGAVDEKDESSGDTIQTYEKNLTNIIVNKTAAKLEKIGINVVLTRKNDETISLNDRVKIANATDATLFLSVHFNAGVSSANGIETFKYVNTKNPLSHKFSENLQNELIEATGFKNRGVKTAGFYVIKHTKMAAALVELGFITNDNEERIVNTNDFQEKVSDALVNAIIVTLN